MSGMRPSFCISFSTFLCLLSACCGSMGPRVHLVLFLSGLAALSSSFYAWAGKWPLGGAYYTLS